MRLPPIVLVLLLVQAADVCSAFPLRAQQANAQSDTAQQDSQVASVSG